MSQELIGMSAEDWVTLGRATETSHYLDEHFVESLREAEPDLIIPDLEYGETLFEYFDRANKLNEGADNE
jgi:hypothetical protein